MAKKEGEMFTGFLSTRISWAELFLWSFGLIGIVLFGRLFAIARADDGTRGINIEVFVVTPGGDPIAHLNPKDFTVTVGGHRSPFVLNRPNLTTSSALGSYVPTRLLIIVAPSASNSANESLTLLAALAPAWRRGWQVSIVRSDGTVTDYATSDAMMKQMWVSAPSTQVGGGMAIQNLGFFQGRRVVLYVVGSQNQEMIPPANVLQRAKAAMAEVFVIDGGVPGRPLLSGSLGEPTRAERAAEGAGINASTGRGTIGGSGGPPGMRQFDIPDNLYREVDLRGGVQDAVRTARGYYELQIPPQPSSPSVIDLDIGRSPNWLVFGQIYPVVAGSTLHIHVKN